MKIEEFKQELNNNITLALVQGSDTYNLWRQLYEGGTYEVIGDDKEMRPNIVGLQGQIESVFAIMAEHKDIPITCTYHTPLPVTPLRNKKAKTGENVVAKEVEEDAARAATVTERTVTVRKLLKAGADIVSIYSQSQTDEAIENYTLNNDNIPKASPGSIQYFNKKVEKYPNLTGLASHNNTCESSESGATYLIHLEDGDLMYSIRAYQAHSPVDGKPWTVWFGNTQEQGIRNRLEEVQNFSLLKDVDINLEERLNNHVQKIASKDEELALV